MESKMKSRVPILFNVLLFFTEFNVPSEGKEYRILSDYCQWGPVKYPSSNTCTVQCAKGYGLINPGTGQLVCFHEAKKSTLISLKDEKTNRRQCGYQASVNAVVPEYHCNPTIVCEYATEDECRNKCDKYTVCISKRRRYLEVSHCGQTWHIRKNIRNLDARANLYYVARDDGTRQSAYNCSCGFGMEGTEIRRDPITKRKKRSNPNEDGPKDKMVASCPIIFTAYDERKCEESCGKVNGMFSPGNKKFICFHKTTDVKLINVTANYCECGLTLNEFQTIACPPDRRIRLNNEAETMDCPTKCEAYKGRIYSPKRFEPDVVYCELPPSDIYKNLKYELGRTVVAKNRNERKYRMYECNCGLKEIGERESSDLQLLAELDLEKQNEEIDNYVNSDFLYDLIHDNENTANNDNYNLETTIVGTEMKSHRSSSLDEVFPPPGVDEIVQPTDFDIPLMSFYNNASPNNTRINGWSCSQNVSYDREIRQNDEYTLRGIFARANSLAINNTHLVPPGSDVHEANFDLLKTLPSEDINRSSNVYHHAALKNNAVISNHEQNGSFSYNIGPNSDTSSYIGIDPSLSQNRQLTYDGSRYPSLQSDDITASRSFSDSTSYLFPNVTLEINEVIRTVGNINKSSKFRQR